jgi:hypothetical protein
MGLGHAFYCSSSKWNQQRKRDAARARRDRERRANQTPQQARSGFYDMDVLGRSIAEEINARMNARADGITLVRLTCTLTGRRAALPTARPRRKSRSSVCVVSRLRAAQCCSGVNSPRLNPSATAAARSLTPSLA